MTEKVWGIVLIVVAVTSILWGINNYRETSVYEGVIYSMVGADRNTRAIIRNEKAYSIACLGGGIILAVIGTILISKVRPNRYIVQIAGDEGQEADCLEPPEPEENNSGRWKF